MTRIRQGACAEPGPFDTHCTEPPMHKYSCYDAGDDSSWNDRSPEEWQIDTPHACGDPACGVTTPNKNPESDPLCPHGYEALTCFACLTKRSGS